MTQTFTAAMWTGWFITLFLTMAVASAESLIQQAPAQAVSRANPLNGQQPALRAGAKLFARECAACHGENGAGGLGKAPPLRQGEVRDAAPGTLFWILRNGALGRGMPSFAHLPEAQRWQIVAYLSQLKI